MNVLGITGGVGAGKSTILEYLKDKYHARIIQCDEAAKLLQQPQAACYQPMIELFGREVLRPDGQFDRKKIAELVFGNDDLRKRLNQIVHPAVKQYVQEEIRRLRLEKEEKLVVIEAALLLEEHYDQICDEIWYIHADDAVRIRRLMESRGYSEEKCRSIMANQKKESDFRAACQLVIDNSSDIVQNTYEQMDKGLREHGFL